MQHLEVTYLKNRLDTAADVNLFQQVYDGLRSAILEGHLESGYRILPSRKLAEELGLSRTTITQALRQLQAEGYLESLVGSGTRVAPLQARPVARQAGERRLSERGRRFREDRLHYEESHFHADAFCPAAIDTSHFPHELWGRSLARVWRRDWRGLMAYAGPAGHLPLRRAIRRYLAEHRQVRCDEEQILVTAGAQQALDLSARVLTDAGDPVGLEEPGYLGARFAFRAAEAACVGLPVDEEGVSLPGVPVRVIYTSPSHQFPTGVCMAVARRLELLSWAERNDAWILEDDYDSEFRYNSRPIPSLKSLDQRDRVVYIGSFSKLLHPSIRVGYMVVPADLVVPFHGAKACSDRQTNLQLQAALVDFLDSEAFGRHIKRMREVYGERRQVLLEALQSRLGGFLELRPRDGAGLHLAGWLPPEVDDWQFHLRARQADLELNSFTQYSLEKPRRGGLVFGFAGLTEAQILDGVTRLARLVYQEPGRKPRS